MQFVTDNLPFGRRAPFLAKEIHDGGEFKFFTGDFAVDDDHLAERHRHTARDLASLDLEFVNRFRLPHGTWAFGDPGPGNIGHGCLREQRQGCRYDDGELT